MITTLHISQPPTSTNKLYTPNRRTGGMYISDDYKAWRKLADAEIMIQRPKPHAGKVEIRVLVPNSVSGNADASNFLKAAEDAVVRAKIIPDDRKKFVARSSAEFADVERTEIIITDVLEIAA